MPQIIRRCTDKDGRPRMVAYTEYEGKMYISIHEDGGFEDRLGKALDSVRLPYEQARDDILSLAHLVEPNVHYERIVDA